MKPFLLIVLLLGFLNSISKGQNSSKSKESENQSCDKKHFTEKVLDFVIANCDDNEIELPNLYDSLSTIIPKDGEERLILVQLLKKRGFKINDWGRGNHPLGPRFVVIGMSKETCECTVTKIYYSTFDEGVYKMTEKIKCKNVSR